MGKFRYQTASPDRYSLLKEYAKKNRENATEAEEYLWTFLDRKSTGHKWRRQHIIGDYIADFVCLKERLIIEVDGAYHLEHEQQQDDEMRTRALEAMGFHVIRFTNEEVMTDLVGVLEQIKNVIEEYN